MCLTAPFALRRASPRAAAAIRPDSYVSLVSQLSYCIGQPVMASLAHCTIFCSVFSALLNDTTFCVDDQVAMVCRRMRRQLPHVGRLVFGHPAATASEIPSIVTMLSSSCSGNSNAARGVWNRNRPACSPSSATASSACRGSASHVSPDPLYVTQRFNTVAPDLAFGANAIFSFSFCKTN